MDIDKDKYYNINEITVNGFFPWIKSYGAVRRYIEYDFNHGNSLEAQYKPSVMGKSGDRFYIKGVNIIKLIARYEDGSLFLNLPRRPYGRVIEKAQGDSPAVGGADSGNHGKPNGQEGI